MRIEVNGAPREVEPGTLAEAMEALGFGGMRVATAVNGAFVPAAARAATPLAPGDRIEVLAPMQGG
jgi:sulfur carrier protein